MDENTVLIAQAQAGDQEAKQVLVEKNLGLVHHIVKRFIGRGYDVEDLFQIGCIGLIKAIDKFDLSFEVKFSTYAVPMIAGEIKRFLRDDGMVKVSRTLKENGWKIRQASDAIAAELGREATLQEISEYTGLAAEEIIMAMEANVEVESIHKTIFESDGGDICLIDRLPEQKNENERLINRLVLEELMDKLSEKERKIIIFRYFEDKTQVEVAKKLGITQVQVSRMEKKILHKMREELKIC